MGSGKRLRRGREFERVYREGRSTRGALLVVREAPTDWPNSRWGFVVSKKVAKRAVDRNRLRRRLRHAASTIPSLATADRVVSVTRAGAAADFRPLRDQMSSLVSRTAISGRLALTPDPSPDPAGEGSAEAATR